MLSLPMGNDRRQLHGVSDVLPLKIRNMPDRQPNRPKRRQDEPVEKPPPVSAGANTSARPD
jgi:hypothetical protein